jgi:hypothetical protein
MSKSMAPLPRFASRALRALLLPGVRYIIAMPRLRFVILTVFAVILFTSGLWLGFFLPRWTGFMPGTTRFNTATVLQQVQTLSQWVTVQFVMEKVVVLEDVKWYGDNRVLLVAHGLVKAGVDLNRLKPADLQVSGRKITVRLSPAQITDAYLDDKQTQVIERTTGLLRVFDKDLEQTARQNAVEDLRRSARIAGILKDADDRARMQLEHLLTQMGFENVEILSR